MMRLKLVGAKRASFTGAANVVVKGQTVDVDDVTGEHLAAQTNRDALNNPHPIWQVVSTTAGDSAAVLDPAGVETEVEEELEGDEVVAEAEEPAAAPRRRTPPKAKTKAAAPRARKKAAT